MFEFAILTGVFCVGTVASVTIYQRRKDVLYGPYIEKARRRPALENDAVEAGAP